MASNGLERLFLRKLNALPQVDEIKQAPPSAWRIRPRVIRTCESTSLLDANAAADAAVSSRRRSTALSALPSKL